MIRKPFVIAEIGCNHMGELAIAKDLVRVAAAYCGVDAVKFQKRSVRELLTPEQYSAPHPEPRNSYGRTYGEHREYLELPLEAHYELKDLCDELGVMYSSSAWDLTSAREIASLSPPLIKVPSARNNDERMLAWLCGEFGGEIHVSTGMSTREEIDELILLFDHAGRSKDLVLYHCVSGYPVDFQDCCLLEIRGLAERYGSSVKGIGFSGHHLGIAIDMAALALGAEYFERHFTLDRTWKGTDHAASLEPDGLRKLVRDLNAGRDSLRWKNTDILPIEEAQRRKLKMEFGIGTARGELACGA